MYVDERFPLKIIAFFAWRNLVQVTAISAAVYIGYETLGYKFLSVPFVPVATIGTAVAFYVGFKNNSSYERLWEARRIWGAILNASRAFAAALSGIAAGHDSFVRELTYRQIAWANALRLQLRRQPIWHRAGNSKSRLPLEYMAQVEGSDEHIGDAAKREAAFDREMRQVLTQFVPPEECETLVPLIAAKGNIANRLLLLQSERLAEGKQAGILDGFEHVALLNFVTECFTQQGASERIKTFPFPRQYAYFSGVFVKIFIFLLPFGLVGEMAKLAPGATWLIIPFSSLIAWVFYTMEQVGDSSEDPFENAINDVPLTTICRTIEVDLRDMLSETNLPPRLQPKDGFLL
ncbi:MAG: hypothetical protein H7Y38_02490 [Armatimonadetes bacterium]|nr:hypothetical protein [Armatimonadota bacterium]